MAVLNFLSYGNYKNNNALENVLRYIWRIRERETRDNELLGYGGYGIPLYVDKVATITAFLKVQDMYNINSRGGRRMNHEVLNFSVKEMEELNYDINVLDSIAKECAEVYFKTGFQVAYAIHYDPGKNSYHIHFAINAINYVNRKKFHRSLEDRAYRENSFNEIINLYKGYISQQKAYKEDTLCS